MKEWKRWTPEDDEAVRRMAAEGHSAKQIGAVIGRSDETVRWRARKKLGIRLRMGARSGNAAYAAKLLTDGAASTVPELAVIMRMTRGNVWSVMRALIKQGKAHVTGYRRSETGKAMTVYAAGPAQGEPPKKPARMPRNIIERRYRKRLKERDPEAYRARYERSNARRRKPRPDVAASWINREGES